MTEKLIELLEAFDGTKATCEEDLTKSFEPIARRVLFGGHFLINGDTRIFPLDIEFYYYNDEKGKDDELNDSRMYHKGRNLPYFPVLSFYPHESGVDVTFENECLHTRASFLIRAYHYEYPDAQGDEENPRFLWEDMFGYHSFRSGGLSIRWEDDESFSVGKYEKTVRKNLNSGSGKGLVQDKKIRRFIKK